MRVLVVDDSAFMRRALSQMLNADPEIQVVDTAGNGKEALAKAAQLSPDVITLDIEMPEMDGLTALRRIMRDSPTQVLIVSSLTTEGSITALQALKLGAGDVLAKDMSQVSLSVTNLQQDLTTRVKALGHAGKRRRAAPPRRTTDLDRPPIFKPGQFDMVCIGSSTGGPPVLETILTSLPATFATPIVVAQHMPEVFTESMANQLNKDCPLTVRHAENHMPIDPGTVYIARGGHHIHLNKIGPKRWELLVNDEPAEAVFKPSVDALLHSAAQHVRGRALGIVLTGIGTDGLQGARDLHKQGGTIIAQDEESCVVYGMPKAVTENALIVASLAPKQIAESLRSLAVASPVSRAG